MDSHKREKFIKRLKSSLFRGLFLALPYLLVAVAVFLTANYGLEAFAKSSIALSTVVEEVQQKNLESNDRFEKLGYIPEEFPKLKYAKVWSLINVDGWKKKNIPVYYGDTNSILMKGAGMWEGSNFCGQNGTTVVSSHVTTYFREIEDTPIGTKLTFDTVYGTYHYEVTDKVVFLPSKASEVFFKEYGAETVIMYTCYPYNSRNRKERIALICTKTEGKVFKDYV